MTINEYQGPRYWLTIRIIKDGDTKFVEVCSTIHVNTCKRLGVSYSAEFSDAFILNDINLSPWLRFIPLVEWPL